MGPSLRVTIADAVRREIMAGALAPGARIAAADVQDAYNVSASAVREALCQLAMDGLVVSEERRGFRVAEATKDDLHDIAVSRYEVEAFALRDSIARGDTQWEGEIVAALHRLNQTLPAIDGVLNEEWFVEHRAFHAALTSASQSQWMRRFGVVLRDQFERYCRLCASLNTNSSRAKNEHAALVQAALARDADRAVAILNEHIWGTVKICLKNGLGAAADGRGRVLRRGRVAKAARARQRAKRTN